MVKESVNNSSGITSVNLGILSIIFALFTPILGIVFGIISLIFGIKQHKSKKNSWSKAGMITSIIGILLSIIIWILLSTVLAPYVNLIQTG